MPFAFQLPTTSILSFSALLSSTTHPSLPQAATTQRNIVRSVLKKHKRSQPQSKFSDLPTIQTTLNNYVPYLLALDLAISGKSIQGEDVDLSLRNELEVQWRSTLSSSIPGREPPRIRGKGLDYELDFALTTLAYTHTAQARASLLTLYGTTTPSPEQRTRVIQNATKSFLTASSIHHYLAARTTETDAAQAVVETLSQTQSALTSLALAEATLLAVLKDDPHPFIIAQMRNKDDKEWMIKAPEIPKVRAHLFARLCLAASEHAGSAEAGLNASGRVDGRLLKYTADLRRTARAKACRLFAIDAELEGETGKAIAWLKGARKELGFSVTEGDSTSTISSFRKLKKDWMEKREDKKIEKGGDWGGDAGRLEELRIIDYLEERWTRMNNTINTQLIPPSDPLIASMPSGREIHSIPPFANPTLDEQTVARMRAPVEAIENHDNFQGLDSSDEEGRGTQGDVGLPGTFPASSSQNADGYY